MSKEKELIKNTGIIFFGKFCTQFLSFLLLPIYTNYLTTSDYGYVDLIQTYVALLIPIILLRLDSSVFRYLIDERSNDKEKNKTISTSMFFMLIQIVLFCFIFIIINEIFQFKYGIYICINVIFVALSNIMLQIVRGIGDNMGYSIASIITGIITILLNIIFIIFLKGNASYILIASSIANLICFIYLYLRNKIYVFSKFKNIDIKKMKKMLKYSIPMIPDGLSWWIVNVSDRSIISSIMGISANGIYAISSKFSNILSAIFQIFNMSWQESASLNINDKDRDKFFNNILNTCYEVFFSICILIMVIMPIIYKIFIGKDYIDSYIYIPILLLANLYNAVSNIYGGVYIAQKNTKKVAKTTMTAAGINIIINIYLIKKFGLLAAAISTLISYIVLSLYRFSDIKKEINMKLNFKLLISTNLIFLASALLYYRYFYNTIVMILNIIFAIIVSLLLNKKTLVKIINKIRKKV